MFEAPVLTRESEARVSSQYSRYDATNSMYMPRTVNQEPVHNFTPNYMPTYQVQNDYYVQPQSDNVTMVNPVDMGYMAQNAAAIQQANYYNPQYVEQYSYNNLNANAQTHPTNMYNVAPQQTYSYNNYYTPIQQENYVEQEYEKIVPQKSKVKNKMTKMLIAVYFLIIAVCATLIIINVVAAASNVDVSASTGEPVYTVETQVYSTNEDGASMQMQKTAKVVDYSYDTSTNWFDKICDKIGNILG